MKPSSRTAADRWDLAYWSLFFFLCALGISPVWVSDLLPLLDAGSHLHLMKIIHDFSDNALYQHHYREVNAIVPYLTYYKAVDWLQYVTDLEQANRLVLTACLLGIPAATHVLLKAVDHNRWLVLGVFPWMLNSDFFMGFFNYLMSIPVFLLVLAAHIRLLRAPSWRGGALVAGLLVFLAITHYLLWGVSLALLPLLALVFGLRKGWLRGVSWTLREVAIVLPSILVLLPWFLAYFVFADGVKTPDQATIHGATWVERMSRIYSGQHLTPLASLTQIFERLFNRFAEQPDHIRGIQDLIFRRHGELISSVWLLGLGLWFMGSVKRARITLGPEQLASMAPDLASPAGGTGTAAATETAENDAPLRWPGTFSEVSRVFVRATTAPAGDVHGTSYAGWVLALVGAAYFVLPQHLSRPIILYGVNFRLVEVLAMLTVVALPVCPLLPARHVRLRVWIGTLAMLVAGVMMPVFTSGTFMLARTEYGSIRDAYGVIPPNRSVLTLRAKRKSSWVEERIFSNIGEYYAVFRGGYVPYSFADSSSKPIITRVEHTLPAPLWYDHSTFGMKPHGRYYDYIAVYRDFGEKPGYWEVALRKWHRVYQRDRWQVYRNPNKAPWPPPTPMEQARTDAVERMIQANLELLGLGPKSTRDLSVDGLLELWQPDLEEMADAIEAKKSGKKGKKRKKRRKKRRRKVSPRDGRGKPVKTRHPRAGRGARGSKPAVDQDQGRDVGGDPLGPARRGFTLPGRFELPSALPTLKVRRGAPGAKPAAPSTGSSPGEPGAPPKAEQVAPPGVLWPRLRGTTPDERPHGAPGPDAGAPQAQPGAAAPRAGAVRLAPSRAQRAWRPARGRDLGFPFPEPARLRARAAKAAAARRQGTTPTPKAAPGSWLDWSPALRAIDAHRRRTP